MKFAQNYSDEAANLLREGLIAIDRFKCAEFPDMIAAARRLAPIYVHFRLLAGQGLLDAEALDAVARLREATDTPFVNTHIAPRLSDLRDPNDVQQVFDAVVRDIGQLVERFGADHVMAENIPFPESGKEPAKPYLASDPELISRVIEATGCGLLLDLGHARRTAEHLAIDPKRHIAQLPTDRLQELHITGLGYAPESGQRVDHMPMREDDWELLAWALENIRTGAWRAPWIVACEYGGTGEIFRWRSQRDVIAHEAPRMLSMVRAAQPV